MSWLKRAVPIYTDAAGTLRGAIPETTKRSIWDFSSFSFSFSFLFEQASKHDVHQHLEDLSQANPQNGEPKVVIAIEFHSHRFPNMLIPKDNAIESACMTIKAK